MTGLESLDGRQGLAAMGGAVQEVVETMADHPVAIHHVGHPAGQQAQHAGDPEGLAQGIAPIHQQGVGQLMASREPLVTGRVVATDPPDLSPQGPKVGITVPEGTGFHGAARGVVLGIEKQHQGAISQLVAATLDPFGIRKGDQGGWIANGERGAHGGGNALMLC